MTARSGWVTRQLVEFLAVLAAAASESAAVTDALDGFAASFETDACVFLQGGQVISSLSSAGRAPDDRLAAATSNEHTGMSLPGLGWCQTVSMAVDRDADTMLVLARAGDPFTADEVALLRGMARVLGLGLRLLRIVGVERRQAGENRDLVASLRQRQDLLERSAQIQHKISSREPLGHVLDAITSGVAALLGDELVALRLIDESDPGVMVLMSSIGVPSRLDEAVSRIPVSAGVGGRAVLSGKLCIAPTYVECEAAISPLMHDGLQSAVAAPVRFGGRPAGSLIVASRRAGRMYSESDLAILVAFAEHASLAINDARTVQAMHEALEDATHRAMYDDLTGLPNRACFYDRTDQALRLAGRDGSCTAVLLFDLDRFKEINDTLGHKYGDRVLREIGPRICGVLRDADTLARLGGDEFCVLLPRVEGMGAALEVAERVMGALEQPFYIDGMALAVEASCGIATAPADGDSADLLLQRSDVAMYLAKASHAGVVTYNADLNRNNPARLAMLGELRTAIAEDQLVLHYQPKMALAFGQIEGVEALIRWQHPSLGIVGPDQFIPLAERTGLIKPLTTWVLNTALCQLRSWQEQTDQANPPWLSMAINVSTRSLLDDAFPTEVAAALDRWQVAPQLLVLEITESAIMADPGRAHRLLTELAAVGVKLAIDDFGTGYSSLAYLKNLPIDELKIDKSFVVHMHDSSDDAIIVRAVIELGRNLGLHTVAEGIEDLDTCEHLTELGCDSAQGYFLAGPMPAAEFDSWLRLRTAASL